MNSDASRLSSGWILMSGSWKIAYESRLLGNDFWVRNDQTLMVEVELKVLDRVFLAGRLC